MTGAKLLQVIFKRIIRAEYDPPPNVRLLLHRLPCRWLAFRVEHLPGLRKPSTLALSGDIGTCGSFRQALVNAASQVQRRQLQRSLKVW